MTEFVNHNNVSVVTAILPQHIANRVIEDAFDAGDQRVLLINARGTLMRERWYQALIPVMSPEKEYLQLLVPDRELDRVMEAIVSTGELHMPGSGAVFAVPCDQLVCTEDFPLWSEYSWESDAYDESTNLRENLTAIFCIVQREQTDQISRAAMQSGAHGPIVFYCEGRGLRDRLGWLRITKKHDKEVIVLVVDNADAVAVTEAMVDAGNIDLPGRGFLYRMPVQKGVINVGTTYGRRKHAANMQQIIAAIDEIKGNADWRDQRVNELVGTGKSAGLNLFGKVKARAYLSGQCMLSCLVTRKHCETLVEAALDGGARGANISYAKLFEAEAHKSHGVHLHHERGIIRVILGEEMYASVAESIQRACAANDISDVCLFSQPVTRAVTYVAEPAGQVAAVASPGRDPRIGEHGT